MSELRIGTPVPCNQLRQENRELKAQLAAMKEQLEVHQLQTESFEPAFHSNSDKLLAGAPDWAKKNNLIENFRSGQVAEENRSDAGYSEKSRMSELRRKHLDMAKLDETDQDLSPGRGVVTTEDGTLVYRGSPKLVDKNLGGSFEGILSAESSQSDGDGFLSWTLIHDGPNGEYQQSSREARYMNGHPHNPLTITGTDMTRTLPPDNGSAFRAYRDEDQSVYQSFGPNEVVE